MDTELFAILKIATYIAFIPIVYRSLMSIDFKKIFKRNHVAEIRVLYILVTIIISKIVADFFLDIIELLLILLNIKPN